MTGLRVQRATPSDALALVSLHTAANDRLVAEYGQGPWGSHPSERGALFLMTRAAVFVARDRGSLIATFALSKRKPWAIDTRYFSTCKLPLYLTSMAVAPGRQRAGIGRCCLDEARRITAEWPADAIRLDAWDADAGAGEFYLKCGFREVARASYKGTPLIYFELLL